MALQDRQKTCPSSTSGLVAASTSSDAPSPLVLCFHGSGDSCDSWKPFADLLSPDYRVLLYDRGPGNLKPQQAASDMVAYLKDQKQVGPYVLVAHSYGGCIAREFLQQQNSAVVGMVLAETGQETALDAQLEKKQYRRQILGRRPLCVIRANSLIGKWKEYEKSLASASNDQQRLGLSKERQLWEAWDKEDERLKVQQLKLSSVSQYVYVPDCGHHIIRDRPHLVAEQVKWVMQKYDTGAAKKTIWKHLTTMFR